MVTGTPSLLPIAGLSYSGNPPSAQLAIGQGWGPAEITLNGIFSKAEVTNLLTGVAGSPVGWPGRYGGNPGAYASGWTVANQPLEWVKFFEYPLDGPYSVGVYSSFPNFGYDDPRFIGGS